jgi:hypothetical protein
MPFNSPFNFVYDTLAVYLLYPMPFKARKDPSRNFSPCITSQVAAGSRDPGPVESMLVPRLTVSFETHRKEFSARVGNEIRNGHFLC